MAKKNNAKPKQDIWEHLEGVSFTLTEIAILQLLEDGEPHPGSEIRSCLPDDLSSFGMHLTRIRYKLREASSPFLIVNTLRDKSSFYQVVREINS